ncbi:hypothetical protein Tco_0551218 [Tanacetum coccineum]
MNRADSSVNLEKQVCDWLSLQHVPKYELSYDVVSRYEKKLVHLEQHVPPPLEPETADHEAIAAYYDLVNAQQENYEQFIQNYNMHSIEKIIVGLHDMLKLTEKGKLKEAATHVVLVIRVAEDPTTTLEKESEKGLDLPSRQRGGSMEEELSYLSGYINKKRIEKLQHDRILQPTIDESFDKCKSCISGKMARKPFPHQIERSKDLLGLIHTDICGPLELSSGSNIDLEIIQEENTQLYENTSEQHDEVVHDDFEPRSEIVPIRGSNRIPQASDRYGFYVDAKEHELGDLIEPPNYKATLTDPESDK